VSFQQTYSVGFSVFEKNLDVILPLVGKPARYPGISRHVIQESHAELDVILMLLFPDVEEGILW